MCVCRRSDAVRPERAAACRAFVNHIDDVTDGAECMCARSRGRWQCVAFAHTLTHKRRLGRLDCNLLNCAVKSAKAEPSLSDSG